MSLLATTHVGPFVGGGARRYRAGQRVYDHQYRRLGDTARAAMVKGDVVECMALPGQSRQHPDSRMSVVPLTKTRLLEKNGKQDRRKQVLFIDARSSPHSSRLCASRKNFSETEIRRIAQTYHNWRGTNGRK